MSADVWKLACLVLFPWKIQNLILLIPHDLTRQGYFSILLKRQIGNWKIQEGALIDPKNFLSEMLAK